MRVLSIAILVLSACAADNPGGDDTTGETGKVVMFDIPYSPGPHDLVGDPCIGVPLVDYLPDTPGLQPDCSASLVLEGVETILPSCDTSDPSCYKLTVDTANCLEAEHLRVEPVIEPEPTTDYRVLLQCVSR